MAWIDNVLEFDDDEVPSNQWRFVRNQEQNATEVLVYKNLEPYAQIDLTYDGSGNPTEFRVTESEDFEWVDVDSDGVILGSSQGLGGGDCDPDPETPDCEGDPEFFGEPDQCEEEWDDLKEATEELIIDAVILGGVIWIVNWTVIERAQMVNVLNKGRAAVSGLWNWAKCKLS